VHKTIFFFIFLISNLLFSQSEIEIIGVKYTITTQNKYYNNVYSSNNNKLDAFVNYGHDLGKENKLFYHISYHNFDINTVINNDELVIDDSTYYSNIPSFSFVDFATGMTNKFSKNWSLTNIINLTITDDFNDGILQSHHYFRTFSYLKKKKTKNLNYGFGVYLSKLNNDLSIYPILSLRLKNSKRGMKLFLPRELKFWNKINSKSYIELKTILNSNYLKFDNSALNIELLSINSELTYNYIYKNKLKLKTGFGLPYTQYKYTFKADCINTSQLNLSFTIGLSYVVFKNE